MATSEIQGAEIRQIVRAFEHGWRQGDRPTIDSAIAETGSIREALVVELAHVEMEFRLKAGEPIRVEHYLQAYPELSRSPLDRHELIASEWSIRRRTERDLSPEEYLERFPDDFEAVAAIVERRSVAWAPLLPFGVLDRPPEPPEGPLPRMFGRFELRERVGVGTFGVVYRAFDTRLRQEVAVKLPRPEVSTSPTDLEHFLREARNAARVRDHLHIVRIYEASTHEGTPYIVSEFIDGLTLAEILDRGRIPFETSATLMASVLDGLAFAHAKNLIHRDLKPSNIMIDTNGRPVVADFGLALRDGSESSMSVTPGRTVVGTLAYMSPEQARGETTTAIDLRSDIFSAGTVLYELLTGELPFRGNERMILAQIEADDPVPPRRLDDTVPPALAAICLKALAKKPEDRYPSATAMADALRRHLANEPEPPPPSTGPFRRLLHRIAARPLRSIALLYATITVVGFPFAVMSCWHAQQPRPEKVVKPARFDIRPDDPSHLPRD